MPRAGMQSNHCMRYEAAVEKKGNAGNRSLVRDIIWECAEDLRKADKKYCQAPQPTAL